MNANRLDFIQWGFKPWLNEVKPPADATDLFEIIYRASSIKSGRKFVGANLITLFNKCLIGINTYRKNTQLIIKAKSRRSFQMEIGISTFVETTPDVETGEVISHAQRIREVVEEIVLADQVGLDIFGVGEHHREDYACSSPAVLLAAAASQTKRIRLTSAVTVLSSADPVRVFQDFATA